MGSTASIVHKRIASMLADKWEKLIQVIEWIRCKIFFSLLGLPLCVRLRGSRPYHHLHHHCHPLNEGSRICGVTFVLLMLESNFCFCSYFFKISRGKKNL